MEPHTYVFQDWNGLLYIIQSKEKLTNAYVEWLLNNPSANQVGMAIDLEDLKSQLEILPMLFKAMIRPI